MSFNYIDDLAGRVEIPEKGALSRTIHHDERVKAVLFAFDTGESLSEHTASMPAIIQILQGEATITLGTETREAQAGAWMHMDAHLPHSIYATTPVVMLLLLLQGQR